MVAGAAATLVLAVPLPGPDAAAVASTRLPPLPHTRDWWAGIALLWRWVTYHPTVITLHGARPTLNGHGARPTLNQPVGLLL